MKDELFAQFMNDPGYFCDTFSFSKGVCDILAGIFALNPLQRTSLAKLREDIMKLDTFFRSQSEETESSTTAASGESSVEMPDVPTPPALSHRNSLGSEEDEDSDEDESPLVTPEGTTSGKPKNIGEVDWKVGSTAELLMARHRLEEQFGAGFY